MAVIVTGLVRHAVDGEGAVRGLALVTGLAGGAVWCVGLAGARRLALTTFSGRHAAGTRMLRTITAGTLVVAVAGFLLCLTAPADLP